MITHVSVRNFKSLAEVDVDLNPLTILVGQNGAGKSNFVDVLRFVSDAVSMGLERAIINRGGIGSIRRYTAKGRPPDISISLRFKIDEEEGEYSLEIESTRKEEGGYQVKCEKCTFGDDGYEVRSGKFVDPETAPPDNPFIDPTTVVLPFVGEAHSAWPIRYYLNNAGYYTIYPGTLREPQKTSPANRLMDDGGNLSSLLRRMKRNKVTRKHFDDFCQSMSSAVPDVIGIDVKPAGSYLVVTLEHQENGHVSTFDLQQESDGTLRLLGVFAALHQFPSPSLITMEEPELNVHPGALSVINEIITQTSQRSQVLITTHSPDLISMCNPNDLRVVEKVKGETIIDRLNERQVGIINDTLFSTGDLLRVEGLQRQSSAA